MHRILVAPETLVADVPRLTDQARRHLKVVRLREGEEVELFDGVGRWRVYAFSRGELKSAGDVCETPAKARVALTLFACITKGSRWDWTIEKATELGVSRIVPVVSERTIVRIAPDEREAKRKRWQRVAEDAARQSDAKWLPEILAPVDFKEAVRVASSCDTYVGAIAVPPPRDLLSALECGRNSRSDRQLAVFVGPEGDFTPAELSALVAVSTPVSFGSTILRAETAAIYGLGVVKAWIDSHEV